MSARLHIFQRGFSLRKNARLISTSRKGGGKRGCLDGSFSSASFRRLREFVVRFSVQDSECWGITLTVPGLELLSIQDFKKIHHLMVVWCNDNSVPLVWRVELQQRKMPHLHCVVYGSVKTSMMVLVKWFKLLNRFQCLEAIDGSFISVSRAFLKGSSHAVDLQRLSGGFDAFRYLVNHMSKAKQAQLGWAGRNWGVCNKSLFSVDEGENFEVSDNDYNYIVRWLKRLTRRRIFSQGCSFWVTNPDIIRRMSDYLYSCPLDSDFVVTISKRLHWEWSYFSLQFFASIPDRFEDEFFSSFRQDLLFVLQELLLLALKWLVYYVPFAREGESLKSFENPAGASLSFSQNESLKFFLIHPLILPSNVVTTKDKVEWYCGMKRGEV